MITSPDLPNLYLLIKVHKPGHPGRPVVNQRHDPTYLECKELTKILTPIAEKGKSFIRDSFDLKEKLKGIKITRTTRLISFDVQNLYPKIPVNKALQCINDALIKDETLSGRTNWKIDGIMGLLKLCLKETHFVTFDATIYTQTDGTPIGKSISGPIAEIYLNWFEESFVYTEDCPLKFISWKRMRDDVLALVEANNDELKKFLEYLLKFERTQNSVHHGD